MIWFIFAVVALILGVIFSAVMEEKYPAIIGGIATVVFLVISCASFVSTGYTGIVTTFGKVHDETLDAGLHFHAPWDNVVTMDNREQRITFSLQAFSKDIQQVDVQGSINYNIDKATAMNLYKDVGTNYANILINPRVQEDVKIKIAEYTAEKLVENRQKASDTIYDLIHDELESKGIHVISFAIENIDFTDAFEAAVEAKQVATQEKQKAQTEQERQTMEATQAAERQRIAAQAQADVAKIQAEAEAYATQVRAEAEANANKQINQSLTNDLIEYNKILHWDGKLPTFIGGDGTMPILNFGAVN